MNSLREIERFLEACRKRHAAMLRNDPFGEPKPKPETFGLTQAWVREKAEAEADKRWARWRE